jgi:molybdopterin synthase sulfur carrier subunit
VANGAATIEVLYFARIAEDLGMRRETQPLAGPVRADAWLADLLRRHPALGPGDGLKIAINQEYANRTSLIHPGDEVALFEPVTGG